MKHKIRTIRITEWQPASDHDFLIRTCEQIKKDPNRMAYIQDQDENIIEDTSIIEHKNFEKNKQRYAVFADEPKDLLQKNYLKYGRQ